MDRSDWDGETQMYRQVPRLHIDRLLFQRWLADYGRYEHPPVSEPRGLCVTIAADYTILHPAARRAWVPS